jgi:transcriptional regulator with XRE-family HTH domain
MVETYSTFGQWLKLRRKSLDLTQEQLARRAGCSAASIKKIEADERRPSRLVAVRLAEEIGLATDQRANFVQVARGELPLQRLPSPRTEMPRLPIPLQDQPAGLPSAAGREAGPFNIPLPVTVLFGRQYELAQICHLLRDGGCRLLTLTGPRGVGKSRLAVEAALALREDYPGGIGYVSRRGAGVEPPILPAIAAALEIPFADPGAVKPLLLEFLHEKQTLLVLDGLDLLPEDSAVMIELVRAAPGVQILATARQHLAAGWEFNVQGLPVPGSGPVDELACSSAAAMFVQRARQAHSGFEVGDGDLDVILRICRLVGGLPAAIEQAALWTRTLSCAEIAQELERSADRLFGSA